MSNPQDGGERPTDLRSRWLEMRQKRDLARRQAVEQPAAPAPVEVPEAPVAEEQYDAAPAPADPEPASQPATEKSAAREPEPAEEPAPELPTAGQAPQHAAAASVLAAFRDTDPTPAPQHEPDGHDADVFTASGPLPALSSLDDEAEEPEPETEPEARDEQPAEPVPFDDLDPLTGPIELVGLDDDTPLGADPHDEHPADPEPVDEPIDEPSEEPADEPAPAASHHTAAASVLAAFRDTSREPDAEPEPNPEPTDEPDAVADPTAEPPAEPDPDPAPTTGATHNAAAASVLAAFRDSHPEPAPEPTPEPTVEPDPEPDPEPTPAPAPDTSHHAAAASVLAAFHATHPDQAPRPEPTPETETEPQHDHGQHHEPDGLDLYPGQAADPDNPPLPPEDTAGRHVSTAPPHSASQHDIAQSVVAAFRVPDRTTDEPADEPSPTAAASPLVAAARRVDRERAAAARAEQAGPNGQTEQTEAPVAPEPIGRRTRAESDAPTAPGAPLRIEFASPRTGQITATLLIVAGLLVTAGMAYVAYDTRDSADAALAGVAAVLTLVVWAIRAGSAPTTVVIDRGILHITRGTSTSSFDLTNVQLDLEEHGSPGQRSWRLQIHRRSLGPVTIDRSMVDPQKFMDAVRRYRRDL
ncbi:MAG TPA: hypothetical protein VGE77_02220 [Nocardioides sp.]